jgi:hypothetical protein
MQNRNIKKAKTGAEKAKADAGKKDVDAKSDAGSPRPGNGMVND